MSEPRPLPGKIIGRLFEYRSKSNPDQPPYSTLLYTDGTTSCDCPGWCRRNVNGVRECKHTLLIDQLVEQEGLEAVIAANPYGGVRVTVKQTRSAVRVTVTPKAIAPASRRFDLSA